MRSIKDRTQLENVRIHIQKIELNVVPTFSNWRGPYVQSTLYETTSNKVVSHEDVLI